MKHLLTSEAHMKQFGHKIGRLLRGGECIQLIGDVGAGKTTLTKGIAEGLDITDTVQSPTFTINRTYDSPRGVRLSHYDFYRLSDPGIMSDELAESLDEPTTAIVIEWGDIVASILPDDHLQITIESPTETDRTVRLEAFGGRAQRLMEELA
ncbi:MAG: tRNA (adenosine(37)-N6)-threonylcarbamoyltransferase complex ATPase subunit type 1 TsaE [Patescibacteria group bacterium]